MKFHIILTLLNNQYFNHYNLNDVYSQVFKIIITNYQLLKGPINIVINHVNSPLFCQSSYQLTTSTIISADIFLFHHSWITSLIAKIRDYPSDLEPNLKPRKAFIYLSYYTLTYPPLTSILPSQRGAFVEINPPAVLF